MALNTKYLFILLLAVTAGIGAFSVYLFTVPPKTEMCKSRNTLIHAPLTFAADFLFRFHEHAGVVGMNGIVEVEQRKYLINRDIYFTYTRSGNEYLLTNTNMDGVVSKDEDASGIRNHLTEFFTTNHGKLLITRKYDADGNTVFFLDGIPAFYCN